MRQFRRLLVTLSAVSFLSACNSDQTKGPNMDNLRDKKDVVSKAWQKLADKRIFFGHQSVGNNILEGMEEISRGVTEKRLDVVKGTDASAFARPVLLHANLGNNTQPVSKLEDFERALDAGIGKSADVALLKFCYVDINASTDIEKLFQQYEGTMERLKRKYSRLKIIHVTVPLTTAEKGVYATLKGTARTLLGKVGPNHHNANRNRFNDLLRKRYQGKEPIYDLASIEATAPDGTAESFILSGRSYYALYPTYTDDGGHLRAEGRARAAEGLLLTLSTLQ